MRKTIALITASLLATPALAAPIDGTWVTDLKSLQMTIKPRVRLLDHGVYHCKTCVPVYDVAADGKMHAFKGDPYSDEHSVKVVDAHTVLFENRFHGKSVGTNTAVVSADGKSIHWTRRNVASNGVVTNSEADDVRLAPGLKGAHLISGSWRPGKLAKADAAVLTATLREEGGMLHMSAPTGESFDAKIGGPAVLIKGDNAGTMAAVRKTSATTWVETDTLKGKVLSVTTMHLVNSTTLAFMTDDQQLGRKTHSLAHKK
jgi:hypothetical protein